ncbi:MAG TPA: hypothetical protein VE978_16660 [Chitinophagales bacterium]|nr:hypothetical protein [Chitinophagales bacterium]
MVNHEKQNRDKLNERCLPVFPIKNLLIMLIVIACTVPHAFAQTEQCKARLINVTGNCHLPVTLILTGPPGNENNNPPGQHVCNFFVEITHNGVVVCHSNWNPANRSQWHGADYLMELKAGKGLPCNQEFIDGELYHVRVADSNKVIAGGDFDFVYHAPCRVELSAPQEIKQGLPFTFTITGDVCDSTPVFSWQIKRRSDASLVRSGTIREAKPSEPISDLAVGDYFIQASTGDGCSSAEKDFKVKCAREDEDCNNEIDDNCNGQINEGCCKINPELTMSQWHNEWFGWFRYKHVTFALPATGSTPQEWKVTLDGKEEELSVSGDKLIFSDRIRYSPPKIKKPGSSAELKVMRTCKFGNAEQTFKLVFHDKMVVIEP